jgi:hypothetical protein
MEHTVLDECLMYRTGSASQTLDGLAGIQVDDALMSGTMAFLTEETAMHSKFYPSSSDEGAVLSYSGVHILQCVGHTEAAITQTPYIHKLLADPLNIQNFADIQFVSGKLAWLANVSRPDITVHVAALSHITDKNIEENISKSMKIISTIRAILEASQDIGPRYLPLTSGKVRIVAFADASFAQNSDGSSQIAGIVFLMSGTPGTPEPAHLLTYFSRKSPRVCTSVFAAETLAFIAAFDLAYSISLDLLSLLVTAPVELYTDSKSLFDTLLSHSVTREKWLMIDVTYLRQTCERDELANVGLVRSAANVDDGLSKPVSDGVLLRILRTGTLTLDVAQFLSECSTSEMIMPHT